MKDCIKKLLFKTEEVASIGTKYAPTVNEASFQSLKIAVLDWQWLPPRESEKGLLGVRTSLPNCS